MPFCPIKGGGLNGPLRLLTFIILHAERNELMGACVQCVENVLFFNSLSCFFFFIHSCEVLKLNAT